MGLQLLVQADSESIVTASLGSIAERAEIFHVEGALWGLSIPTKVLAEVGEENVRRRLLKLSVYDLYKGEWKYVEPDRGSEK